MQEQSVGWRTPAKVHRKRTGLIDEKRVTDEFPGVAVSVLEVSDPVEPPVRSKEPLVQWVGTGRVGDGALVIDGVVADRVAGDSFREPVETVTTPGGGEMKLEGSARIVEPILHRIVLHRHPTLKIPDQRHPLARDRHHDREGDEQNRMIG